MSSRDTIALKLIQGFESCVLTAYQDEAGVWTIGWGTTGVGIVEGLVWTQEQADRALESDYARVAACLGSSISVPLTDHEWAALASLTYNIGIGAFLRSTLLRVLNAGNYDAVPTQMLRWDHITVDGALVISPGLDKRRRAEVQCWLTDDTPEQLQLFVEKAGRATEVKERSLLKTKTVAGVGTSTAGVVLDTLTNVDWSTASLQVNQYRDLGSWVHWLSFGLIILGLVVTIYARMDIRKQTGL